MTGAEAWQRVDKLGDAMPFRMRSKFLYWAEQFVAEMFPEIAKEYQRAMYDAGWNTSGDVK